VKILVLNAGSSSQKSCLYQFDADHFETTFSPPKPVWEGQIDWSHEPGTVELKIKTEHITQTSAVPMTSRLEIMKQLISTLWQGETQVIAGLEALDGVGHRVVQGGRDYRESVLITPDVKAAIDRFSAFAPLHNPPALEGIEVIEQLAKEQAKEPARTLPQVAVFDTAFHAQMPPTSTFYPLPYEWYEQGIQRYGFHGTSHQYVARRSAQILNQKSPRLITCHLGNGCSLAAILEGKSVATTMGFTPLDGVMMGTRCGAIDPGILIYLLRQGYLVEDLDRALNHESGLLGISGVSSDMRKILSARSENPQAQLAFDLFIDRLRSSIASLLPALGGLDALVFTGGIGEHAAEVRGAVCRGLEFLGWQLDEGLNSHSPVDQDIATEASAVRILVVKTEEDWAIAGECCRFV
jgi:acetate kinase